jgi:hypothetical protein
VYKLDSPYDSSHAVPNSNTMLPLEGIYVESSGNDGWTSGDRRLFLDSNWKVQQENIGYIISMAPKADYVPAYNVWSFYPLLASFPDDVQYLTVGCTDEPSDKKNT